MTKLSYRVGGVPIPPLFLRSHLLSLWQNCGGKIPLSTWSFLNVTKPTTLGVHAAPWASYPDATGAMHLGLWVSWWLEVGFGGIFEHAEATSLPTSGDQFVSNIIVILYAAWENEQFQLEDGAWKIHVETLGVVHPWNVFRNLSNLHSLKLT